MSIKQLTTFAATPACNDLYSTVDQPESRQPSCISLRLVQVDMPVMRLKQKCNFPNAPRIQTCLKATCCRASEIPVTTFMSIQLWQSSTARGDFFYFLADFWDHVTLSNANIIHIKLTNLKCFPDLEQFCFHDAFMSRSLNYFMYFQSLCRCQDYLKIMNISTWIIFFLSLCTVVLYFSSHSQIKDNDVVNLIQA